MCVFLKQHFMSTLERNYKKQKNEQMMQTSYLHGAAAAAMVVAKKENCLQPRQHRWIFGSSAKIFGMMMLLLSPFIVNNNKISPLLFNA